MNEVREILLDGAPALYRMPEVRPSPVEVRAFCHQPATTHYENFHVVTWFLPKGFGEDVEAIYLYCRGSDDLGDEIESPAVGTRLLDEWGELLRECYEAPEHSRHPICIALAGTIREPKIPMQPFCDLLKAFKAEQVKVRHASIAELEEYSVHSANPVGRLVLHTCGYHDEALNRLSDRTCTALQLANLFVDRKLAVTLRLFRRGGESILNMIEAQSFDTLKKRPVVSKTAKVKLLSRALLEKLAA